MIIAIVGDLGSGKTTLLTALLHKLSKTKKIFTNFNVTFPHKLIKTADELQEVRKGVIGCSDFWEWLDAYTPFSMQNRIVSQIVLYSRKRELDLIYDTQYLYGLIGVRARRITQFIITPEITGFGLRADVHKKDGTYVKTLRIRDIRSYWEMFNTFEEAQRLEKVKSEIELKRIKDITHRVIDDEDFGLMKTKKSQIGYLKNVYSLSENESYMVLDLIS